MCLALPRLLPLWSRMFLLFAVGLLFCPAGVRGEADPATEWLHRMNTGQAQLENGDFAAAIASYQAVLAARTDDPVARRNLARAQIFNADLAGALATLAAARAAAPLAATEYLTGLVHLRRDDPAAALPFLENAVRLDPHTAALRFQLAKACERLDRGDDALAHYRETVRLDPQHAAAHFELAMHARNRRDLETYREELRAYKRLRDLFGDPEVSPLLLEACAHTRAEPAPRPAAGTPPAFLPVRFVAQPASSAGLAALAPLALDADGRYAFAALTRDGQLRVVSLAADGTPASPGPSVPCPGVGDHAFLRIGHSHDSVSSENRLKLDLPRFSDVLVVGAAGLRLFERNDASGLVDVTERAGLAGATGGRDALWLDYEHDGDLDFVVASDSGLMLWQNRGDGRFEKIADAAGLTGGGRSLALADLDGNGAVDLVAANGDATQANENQRAGRFRPMPTPPGPWPAADRVLLDDLDNDTRPDVALIGAARTVLRFGGVTEPIEIAHAGFTPTAAALFDSDNDGWLDLALVGPAASADTRTQVRLWRNDGGHAWRESSLASGNVTVALAGAQDLLALDHDGDGDSDLMLLGCDGSLAVLRNEGGQTNRQLKVRLNSLAMANHGGIGATVAVRAGGTLVSRFVTRELPLEIGLGRLAQIDSLQVVWPDGTVDNLLAPATTGGLAAVQRASNIVTGSCPYLFAWDGDKFRFVTDFLGSGALGLAATRDLTWPPDPIELVRIGDATELRPRDGKYVVMLTSELREVDYFDTVRLVAVDLPAGREVHPTDSFMPPPVTPSELWVVDEPLPLRAAQDTRGRDVTAELSRIDGRYALPGEVLPPPLLGVCRSHSCTFDFGDIPSTASLTIAVTGLLEFGTASSNIALSQTDTASLNWPALEAETADGIWHPVAVNLGIPDGRAKTTVADLTGKLPTGTRRLRLSTSFQIYWDRVALFRQREVAGAQRHDRPFATADLQWRGFSRVRTGDDGHTRVPVFDDLLPQPPWHTTLEGWCTRYGDVRELIGATDGMIAILNGGDALELTCPADAFPPVPAGHTRTFFIDAVGWDKEENNNTVQGATVEPLPGQPPAPAPAHDDLTRPDWVQRYNTRWVPRDRFAPAIPDGAAQRETRADPSPTLTGSARRNLSTSDGK